MSKTGPFLASSISDPKWRIHRGDEYRNCDRENPDRTISSKIRVISDMWGNKYVVTQERSCPSRDTDDRTDKYQNNSTSTTLSRSGYFPREERYIASVQVSTRPSKTDGSLASRLLFRRIAFVDRSAWGIAVSSSWSGSVSRMSLSRNTSDPGDTGIIRTTR